MKKVLIFFVLMTNLFLGVSFAAKAAGQSLDQMVAIVNDDLITRSELDRAITSAKMQISQQNPTLSNSEKSLEKQALDQLINKKLQLQAAAQAGLTVSDDEVEKAIQTIASQNNVTADVLFDHVKQEGMTPAVYRTEIHDQIVLQRLQQHEVAGKVTVTPEEIASAMKSAPAPVQAKGPSEYRVLDIVIPTSDTPTTQELTAAKTRADRITQKLKIGVAFDKIAATEANAKPAMEGGDLGWRSLAEIPTAFADSVAGMKKQSVAGPIKTGNGFHVLVMTDIRTQGDTSPSNDRKTVEAMLLQKKFEQAIQVWMSRLRSQAFITITA